MLGHVLGPLRRPDWRGLIVSASKQLTMELADAVGATAEISGYAGWLQTRKKTSSCDAMTGPERTRLEFHTASSRTGHSSSANLVVLDEAGLLAEAQRPMWEACLSSISARRHGRLIALGVRSTGPMFRELLTDQKRYCAVHNYSAAPTARIDEEQSWKMPIPDLAASRARHICGKRPRVRRTAAGPNKCSELWS